MCYSVLVHSNTNFFVIEFQCTSMFLASKLGKAKILIAKYAVTRCPYGQKFVLQRTSAPTKKIFSLYGFLVEARAWIIHHPSTAVADMPESAVENEKFVLAVCHIPLRANVSSSFASSSTSTTLRRCLVNNPG